MNRRRQPARQVAVEVLAFLIAGTIAGVLWFVLVDLPDYTRTADNGSMQAVEMSRFVAVDGWYTVIGGVLALLVGAALTAWATRPRLNVLTILGAAGAAGLVMLGVGRLLGPGNVEDRLAAASEGDLVPVELIPSSAEMGVFGAQVHVIFLVWPIAALAGTALVLIFGPAPVPAPDPHPAGEPIGR